MVLLQLALQLCSSAALYSLPPQNAASYAAAGANASLLRALCSPACIVQLDTSLLPPPAIVPGSSIVAVDVTAALTAAIANASSLYEQHGQPCVVVLEAAVEPYFIYSTISVSSGVIISGALNSSFPQSTLLVPDAAKFTAFSFSGSPSVAASATGVNDVNGSTVPVTPSSFLPHPRCFCRASAHSCPRSRPTTTSCLWSWNRFLFTAKSLKAGTSLGLRIPGVT